MFLSFRHWVLFSISAAPSLATIYNNPSELPKTKYDYIVIGSGAGGGVVAARLSEDPNVNVLLVEAGPTHEGILASEVPLLSPSLTGMTKWDWNYTTTPQAGYYGRSIHYPRGKLLGGSTSVNYLVHSWGSFEDWDSYARVADDASWSWDSMKEFAARCERVVPPADGRDTSGQYIPEIHSTTGTLPLSLPGWTTPLDSRVILTTQQLPEQFPYNPDLIGGSVGSVLGIGWGWASIKDGMRSSSATAYVVPAASRPNLDVVLNAQATKLLRTGTVKDKPSFHAVTVQEKADAVPRNLTAKHEIVLSAGTFGTPTLLQLSGIGDTAKLQAAGIETIVHNPSVGRNMSDHILVPVVFEVNSTSTFDTIVGREYDIHMEEWQTSRTGPMANGIANHYGWFRLPDSHPALQGIHDPATGPTAAHYQFLLTNGWNRPGQPRPAVGDFMSVTTNLISPLSRGDINVVSSNPFTPPALNPNFLDKPFDIAALVYGIKSAKAFVSAPAWDGYVLRPYGELADANTDEEIEHYVRGIATTVFHATGTAMMSPKGAAWGVVDPDLKVKGVEGLRIVDGSILPAVPTAHTQGPIYLVGERGAEFIKAARAMAESEED